MSIHTILSQEIEKLMNKMGTDHRIFMLADGKTRNDLENTIRTFAARIVEEVGKELIGELKKYHKDHMCCGCSEGYHCDFENVYEVIGTKLQKMKEI